MNFSERRFAVFKYIPENADFILPWGTFINHVVKNLEFKATFGPLFGHFSANFGLIFDYFSATFRPLFGCFSVAFQPLFSHFSATFRPFMAIFELLYWPRGLWIVPWAKFMQHFMLIWRISDNAEKWFFPLEKMKATIAVSGQNSLGILSQFHFEMTPSADELWIIHYLRTFPFWWWSFLFRAGETLPTIPRFLDDIWR